MEDLLSSVASGDKPTSVLKQLSTLQSLVQRRETDKLAEALEELRDTPALSEGKCLTPVQARSCPHWPFHPGICLEASLTCPCRLTRVPICPCRLSVIIIIIINLIGPAQTRLHLPVTSSTSHTQRVPTCSRSRRRRLLRNPQIHFLPVHVFFLLLLFVR